MNANQLSHSIYKLLEQTDIQIIEMLKGADAATLNQLLDEVPSFVQSAVQHCIDELPDEPTDPTLIEEQTLVHNETDEEITIITTYENFDWDYDNDELIAAYNGTMEFIGIDAADYDPHSYEEIDVEHTLEY